MPGKAGLSPKSNVQRLISTCVFVWGNMNPRFWQVFPVSEGRFGKSILLCKNPDG